MRASGQSLFERLFGLDSLHGRFRSAAAAMTLLLVVGAWLTLALVDSRGREATDQLKARNEVVTHSRHLRDEVWRAEYSLQSFLLAPDEKLRRETAAFLVVAMEHTGHLGYLPWVVSSGLAPEVEKIRADLLSLTTQVDRLMALRVDPEQLFPAMKIMRDVMEPANNGFYTAATLAIEDALANQNEGRQWEAYRLLEQVRHAWSRQVSTFRVYVVNRTGTFGDAVAGLQGQAHNVRLFWSQIDGQLKILEKMDRQGVLSFQASSSVEEMRRHGEMWMRGFEATNQIYARSDWRTDAPLMQKTIQPLFASINAHLRTIEGVIEKAAAEDVSFLTTLAQHVSHGIWVVIAVGLLLFYLAFAYFERTALRPIAQVARALKSEAAESGSVELPVVDATETHALVEAFAEMRKQVHRRQQALEHQATHDQLTGLPNRALLLELMQQAITVAHLRDGGCALLVMDLNRFKEINDTLGHETGDQLLQQVRKRLLRVMEGLGTVARLGGDEFALLLPDGGAEEAERMADQIREIFARPYVIEMHTLYVGCGVGVALFPSHGEDVRTLIQRAEVAMYGAKAGNCGHLFYSSEMDQHSLRRLALESDLHDAIRENNLELYYQPKLNLRSGRTIGVEALIRWFHPERGFVPPEELVTVAETAGLIKALTYWVVDTAVRQCAEWRAKGYGISVAVNLSVWNLQDPGLVTHIRAGLERYGIPPSSLELEITESAMMADPNRALEILGALDAMGMSIAVDDFGTGFSSLAYLKRLPVDALKIDKSFVMGMTEDENDAAIVRSTIDLAHNLGLKVVAEGVETHEHWSVLDMLGCDTAQGYYMSRPLPAATFEEWLGEAGHHATPQAQRA